jgi:hypothetical protein
LEAHRNLFRAVVDGDVELAHQFGEIVRVVSPLGRDGHEVTVGATEPKPLRAITDVPKGRD